MKRFLKALAALLMILTLLSSTAFAAEKCKRNRKNDGTFGPHRWGNQVITMEATCTERGREYKECKLCHEKKWYQIPSPGHDWGEWSEAMTRLQQNGSYANYRSRTCTRCNGVEEEPLDTPIVKPLSVGTEGAAEAPATLEKWVGSVPGNGQGYYEEGETILYCFLITNNATTENEYPIMLHIEVYDELLKPEGRIDYFEGIMPGGQDGFQIEYTVTAEDVERGYIENKAKMIWQESDMSASWIGEHREAWSETVIAYTRPDTIPEEETIAEEETSKKRSFLLTDQATVGKEYDHYFTIHTLAEGHEFQQPQKVSGDLEDFGFEYGCGMDEGAWIWVKGTPTHSGVGDCVYSMAVDDEVWMITVEITVTEPEESANSVTITDTAYVGIPYEYTLRFAEVLPDYGEYLLKDTGDTGDINKSGIHSGHIPTQYYSFYGTPEQAGTCSLTMKVEADGELCSITFILTVLEAETPNEPEPEPEYSVYLELLSFKGPQNAVPGDEFTGAVKVTNTGSVPLDVNHYFIINGYTWMPLDYLIPWNSKNLLQPGENYTVNLIVIMTEDDQAIGRVTRQVTLYGETQEDDKSLRKPFGTNTVTASAILGDEPVIPDPEPQPEPEPEYSVYLELLSFDGPQNAVPGDEFNGAVKVTNTSSEPLDVYDYFITNGNAVWMEVDDLYNWYPNTLLQPGESCIADLCVILTEDDLLIGELTRLITVYGLTQEDEGEHRESVDSNTVTASVKLGDEPEIPEDPDGPTPVPEDPDGPTPVPEDPDGPTPVPEDPDGPTPVPNTPAKPTPAPDKALVVYFSATGNTKTAAEEVARQLGADLFEVVPAVAYTADDLNYTDSNARACTEQADPTARPAISSMPDLSKYNLVVIGYPVWMERAPRIIFTFVEQAELSGKTVTTFCTSHSSPLGECAQELMALKPSGINWLASCRFAETLDSDAIAQWLHEIALK